MQNLDSEFKNRYPGYKATTNYSQAYQTWSQTTLDTIRGSLDSVGLQSSDFDTESSLVDQLNTLSKTSSGRMQALQTGNMIASQQVSQMQKLRQLVMAQTNAQNTYMAYKVQKEQSSEASLEKMIENGDTQVPNPADYKGFGADDSPTLKH